MYGKTCNPYNTTRNVGVSSGGESCIIAARGSPIGIGKCCFPKLLFTHLDFIIFLSIGTDIGGSIRIPAFRCGIFGHKPSNDIVSTAGKQFLRMQLDYSVIHLHCRVNI